MTGLANDEVGSVQIGCPSITAAEAGRLPRPPPTLKSGFGLCLRVHSPNMLTADSVWVATPAWTQRLKSAGSLLKGDRQPL